MRLIRIFLVAILLMASSALAQTVNFRIAYQISTGKALGTIYSTGDSSFPNPDSYYVDLSSKQFGIPTSDIGLFDWKDDDSTLSLVSGQMASGTVPDPAKGVCSGVIAQPVVIPPDPNAALKGKIDVAIASLTVPQQMKDILTEWKKKL